MNKIGLFSMNNLLVVEAYQQGQGLKEEIRHGIAFVKQKKDLAGLKLLVEARLEDGSYVPAGSTVYVQEDILSTAQWAKNTKRCDALGEKEFILLELKYASIIDTHENVR